MQTKPIIAAALSALALPAVAAPFEAPYALGAVHADFQAQLERGADLPGETGAAARAAAGLMAPHSAAQERLVLPLLGWADAATTGHSPARADLPGRMQIEAELAQLHDGDVTLVTALAELYATAEAAGEADAARLAERIIWHETGDVEVLYPAALLVGSAAHAQATATDPATIRMGPGPLYGEHPVPMIGAGNPHKPASRN